MCVRAGTNFMCWMYTIVFPLCLLLNGVSLQGKGLSCLVLPATVVLTKRDSRKQMNTRCRRFMILTWASNFVAYSWWESEQDSSVSIVSGYGLDDRAIAVQSSAEAKGFFFLASLSRPTLGPTQPPVQWVPGALPPELKRGRVVTLTTHPRLVPRSRMSRSYTSSPPKRLRGVWWNSLLYGKWNVSWVQRFD
jgi:hypothetical protein